MLTTLRIENFVIVKQLELNFTQGMTAFTGETGAGKSIMIDALLLALGGRAEISVIRPGEQKCDVSAVFQVDMNSPPTQWLAENDIDLEQGEIILRRVLYSEGRSKSYINGQPFPLQKVKELSEMLVCIHGQHQHQTLLQHATHRQQLDNYADHHELLHNLQKLYSNCQKTKTQLDHLQNQDKQNDRIQLLQFQIEELQALNLQEGEMQSLNEEHQRLHHAKDYLQHTQYITQSLNGEDETPSVYHLLNQILNHLNQLPLTQSSVKNTIDLVNNALIQCEEARDEMEQFADLVQLDPERLQEVETRLSALHHMARKHHVDVNSLFEHSKLLQNEMSQLQNNENQIAQLQKDYQQQLQAYEKAALALRAARQAHTNKLAFEITAIIQQLGMPKGQVKLEMTPLDKPQAHGLDKIEYKVSTNPGLLPDSLSKVASGGELSRISLAIQMITAQRGATPTLLFDEVDVGIGGATAALVGKLLRNLGSRLQIFCVTHQPQVASSAHNHFVVSKYSEQDETFATIESLAEVAKVDEIARMLGGLTITEQTRSHAKELLSQSHS